MKQTSEYNITLKIRNNLLLQAFKDAGETPGKILAEKIGISYGVLNHYISLKLSPIDNNDDYRESAYKICDFLNMSPNELWTDEQLTPLDKSTVEFTASHEQLTAYLPSYGDITAKLEHEDLQIEIAAVLEGLDPRYKRVIELRFGLTGKEHTLEEIGEELGVSPARARQMEAKALRQLRNPLRTEELRPYVDPSYDPTYCREHEEIEELRMSLSNAERTYDIYFEYMLHCRGIKVDNARWRPHARAGLIPPTDEVLRDLADKVKKLKARLEELETRYRPLSKCYGDA